MKMRRDVGILSGELYRFRDTQGQYLIARLGSGGRVFANGERRRRSAAAWAAALGEDFGASFGAVVSRGSCCPQSTAHVAWRLISSI